MKIWFNHYFVFLLSTTCEYDATLTETPRNSHVLRNNNALLSCKTDAFDDGMQVKWRHRAVGSSVTNDVYNGEFGFATVYYAKTGRHSISHKNKESGQDEEGRHDLKISNVIDSDAGTYFCIDKNGGGEEKTAELIVIRSVPQCSSNITHAVGDTYCQLEPDNIGLSCSVEYHGNIAPILEWRKGIGGGNVTSGDTTPAVTKDNTAYKNITLAGQRELEGQHFVCEVKDLQTNHQLNSNCSTQTISISYLQRSEKIQFETFGESDSTSQNINCSALTNNLPCNYSWAVGNEIINESDMTLDRLRELGGSSSQSVCFVECEIRGARCGFPVKIVRWTDGRSDFNTPLIVVSVLLCMITVAIVIALAWLRHQHPVIFSCRQQKTTNNPSQPSLNSTLLSETASSGVTKNNND